MVQQRIVIYENKCAQKYVLILFVQILIQLIVFRFYVSVRNRIRQTIVHQFILSTQ